jgi:hypothetical protein
MDESEYIGNWVETKTTLSEWLEHRNFDHWEVLNELGLSESQIENIENHQFSLFNEAVRNSVISMINSYPDVVKNIVFTEHLRILDLFLNSTKVEKFLIELLKPIVNIREQDYLGILKEYQNVIARKYNDFETDFNIYQKGSFFTGLYFTASIIFDYKSAIEKHLKALPPQPIVKSPFSVLEWATIFYYADETKLLSESPLLKTRLEQFMSKHQINTTFDNFKTKYYEAKKRINEKNDYPINKLELIIPFLKENYKQTVTKVENDIIFLEENKPEY